MKWLQILTLAGLPWHLTASLAGQAPLQGTQAAEPPLAGNPRVLTQPPWPRYPKPALDAGIQGEVRVKVTLGPDGVPLQAKAQDGPEALRAEAEAHALLWRFEASKAENPAAAASVLLTVPFRLPAPWVAESPKVVLTLELDDPRLAMHRWDLQFLASEKLRLAGLQFADEKALDPARTCTLLLRIAPAPGSGGGAGLQVTGRLSPLEDSARRAEFRASSRAWVLEQTVRPEGPRQALVGAALGTTLESVVSGLLQQAGLGDKVEAASTSPAASSGSAAAPAPGATASPSAHGMPGFAALEVIQMPPAPRYPPLAKLLGIQGTVVLGLIVNEQGTPTAAEMYQGHPQLLQAARDFGMMWRFKPFQIGGRPVVSMFKLTIPFRLSPPQAKLVMRQAVVEAEAMDPSLQALVPDLKAEAEAALARLGVVLADPGTAQADQTLQVLVQVSPVTYCEGCRITLTFRTLSEALKARASQETSRLRQSSSLDLPPSGNPSADVRAAVREIIPKWVQAIPGQQ